MSAEEEVLRNVQLLGALQTFIDDEQVDETGEAANLLECWLALDAALQLVDDNDAALHRAAATRLVSRFVAPSSKTAVRCFDVDVQAALLQWPTTGRIQRAQLRRAQANVFQWLQKQLFPEFFASDVYRRVRRELDEAAQLQIAALVLRAEVCGDDYSIASTSSSSSTPSSSTSSSSSSSSTSDVLVLSSNPSHVIYVIQCRGQIATWLLYRRYSELREFNRLLRLALPNERELAALAFPKKKAFGTLNDAFVRQRLDQLRTYLSKIQRIDAVIRSPLFREFFLADWHARRPALVPQQLTKIRNDVARAVNSLDAPAALQAAQRALELAPGDAVVAVAAAHAYALSGQLMRALEWLTAALAAGYANFANLKQEAAFQQVRRMPQFAALLAQYPERDAVAASAVSPRVTSTSSATNSAQASPARRTPQKRLDNSSAADMLAGDGWGALNVELVLLVLDWLPATDLSHAALVCRRWQLLCYASHLWRCVARTAPRTAEGRVRPRLRRRFFGKAVRGILIGSFPVSYTDKLNFLEAMFSEFNVEAMSAVYASYNGSMYKTISYLQSHASAERVQPQPQPQPHHHTLTTSMPTTLAERALSPPVQASHVLDTRRGTVSRDWRHELKERAGAFDEQSKLLLGATATDAAPAPASDDPPLADSGSLSNVSYFIARPVTSVYTLSANGYLAYELTHNPLLMALQQRTEFVDLVNILVEENCLLLVPQESTVRHLEISRHFIQHHIVILDDAREPPAPTVARRRRRRLYSGPVEIELLNMLLSVDKDESETVTAPGSSVFDSTMSPVKASAGRSAAAAPAAVNDDDVDEESSGDGANKDELERAVGLSTLSGARGTINRLRTSLRVAVDVDDRGGGEKQYQTVRFLREGKVSIGGSVLLHVVVISGPLQRHNQPWPLRPGASPDAAAAAAAAAAATAAAAAATPSSPDEPSRALEAPALAAVRNSLTKPIEKLVRRTKKKTPTSAPLPTYEAGDDGAIGSSISSTTVAGDDDDGDLGIIGNAAWRELPMLVRQAMPTAPPHQVNLMTSWAQTQFFAPLCRRLMDSDKEALEKDAFFATQLKRLSFVTMEHLGIAAAYADDELFQTAMDELAAINDVVNPNEKLACILNCCRVLIYQLQSGGSAASADDFLPHLIWVVLKGNVERLHANCAYIRDYSAPDALRMEAQYFFTNVEICTSFIESIEASYLKMDEEEFDRLYNQRGGAKSSFGRVRSFFGGGSNSNNNNSSSNSGSVGTSTGGGSSGSAPTT
jgi:hypothetical protein